MKRDTKVFDGNYLGRFVSELEGLINVSHAISIVGHFNPDGDSIGSVTAMKLFIQEFGKEAKVLLPSPAPDYLLFNDPKGEYLVYTKTPEEVERVVESSDLIICLDFNKISRTEGMAESLNRAKGEKVLIDHHVSPEVEAFDLVYSMPSASSTCELVFYLVLNSSKVKGDIANFRYDCALALSVGLLTDTNQFKNSTSVSTFKMASLLLERGINLDELGQRVFGSYRESRMRLMGEMLRSRMMILKEYKAAYMVLTLEMQQEFNYMRGDSEGFVNLPLLIDGVEVSAMFTEDTDYIRVSLRSIGDFSVNKLSQAFFNGGGHERAAGGRLHIPVEEVPAYFEDSLRKFVNGDY